MEALSGILAICLVLPLLVFATGIIAAILFFAVSILFWCIIFLIIISILFFIAAFVALCIFFLSKYTIQEAPDTIQLGTQATPSLSATSCLGNQPLVIVSHSSSNYVHQERCPSIFDSRIQVISNSFHQEGGIMNGSIGSFTQGTLFTSLNSNLSSFQQGCAASGVYGQPARSSTQCQGNEVADQMDIAQEDACYNDETQVQTSHEEEHDIDPTESEGKISTEDTSTAQGHKHVEVKPQLTPSISEISCLVNQPLIVIVASQINENNVNQGGSGNSVFAPNTQSGPSTSNESVFFGVEPTMRSQEYPGFGAIQQGYDASGSYEQAGGGAAINNIYQSGVKNSLNAPNSISGLSTSNKTSFSSMDSVDNSKDKCVDNQQVTAGIYEHHAEWIAQYEGQIAITQGTTQYTDETQIQTSHDEEDDIEPTPGQSSDDTCMNTTQGTLASATTTISTCTGNTAAVTQENGSTKSQTDTTQFETHDTQSATHDTGRE